MRNVSDKSCIDNQNTHFVFNYFFFPPENRAVYGVIWKNILDPGRPQIVIWRTLFHCSSLYLHYLHCLSCHLCSRSNRIFKALRGQSCGLHSVEFVTWTQYPHTYHLFSYRLLHSWYHRFQIPLPGNIPDYFWFIPHTVLVAKGTKAFQATSK